MALSIDRLTNIITVPKADLAHVIGTLYEHDTDAFWDELKALEAAEEGIVFVDAQSHNLEYTVVGITYAQKVEMINGYQVEYENGMYSVRLVGSNNNIFDVEGGVLVQNTVQVIPGNSAGLIREDYTSIKADIKELLGLSFKYSYRHSRVYDNNSANGPEYVDRLIYEKLDTYTSKAAVLLHDGVTGLLGNYEVTYTYADLRDRVYDMVFVRVDE